MAGRSKPKPQASEKSYRVESDRVRVQDTQGRVRYFGNGEVLPQDLPPAEIARQLEARSIAVVRPPKAPKVPDVVAGSGGSVPSGQQPPADVAS